MPQREPLHTLHNTAKYMDRYVHYGVVTAIILAFFITIVLGVSVSIFGVVLFIPLVLAATIVATYFCGYGQAYVASGVTLLFLLLTGSDLYAACTNAAILLGSSIIAALILRSSKTDPLFRLRRDVLMLTGGALTSSLVYVGGLAATTHSVSILEFVRLFAVSVCTTTIVTPFLMRWFSKPRFSRTKSELLETVSIFTALILLCELLYISGVYNFLGVPIEYFLLIPMTWIALRLRPRFVTLGSVIIFTAVFIGALNSSHSEFSLQTALFLATLSVGFLMVTSQEEERRVYKNRTRQEVATLENALARIEIESKAKNEFIAILSHELRNPLAPIISTIELLKLNESVMSQEADSILLLSERSQAVQHLLNDLLDISKIGEGKIAVGNEPVDVLLAINRAILSTEHYRVELHQSLSFTPPATQAYTRGDIIRIEQIISNLLSNASKYSNSGDTVLVSLTVEDSWIQITVSDKGVGISSTEISQIFEPFRQVPLGERTAKGLGIGLSLVKQLAELHGGSVTAHSDGENRGSTFSVRLPRSRD